MTTTPEEQALIEAVKTAIGHKLDLPGFLTRSYEAYRASIAPKDCRPPSDAKDGSLWWLVFEDIYSVARWDNGEWYLIGHRNADTPQSLNSWTVRAPCTFPGERVEPTDDAVEDFLEANGYENGIGLVRIFREGFAHFARPKLRDITDAEIAGLWVGNYGVPWDVTLEFVRAVERLIKGE